MTKMLINKTLQEDMKNLSLDGNLPLSLLLQDNSKISDIVNRFQTMYANENLKTTTSQSKSKLLSDAIPYTSDNKYSLFAFEKPDGVKGIMYPLITPYKSKTSFECPAYSVLKQNFSKAFKIKVVEKNNLSSLTKFKKKKMRLLFYTGKVLKRCVTIITFGKKKFTKTPADNLKGKLYIRPFNSVTGQPFSQTEKMMKMYGFVSNKVVDKIYRKSKMVSSNENTVKLISSLIATQYVASAVDFGSNETNKAIHSSLSLQISNAFASMKSLSNTDKQNIIKLSSQTTDAMLKKLNLQPSNIIDSVNSFGFKLNVNENPSVEEIIFAKQTIIPAQTILEETKPEEDNTLAIFKEKKITTKKPINSVVVTPVVKEPNLTRKSTREKFDTLVCKTYAEMIEKFNTSIMTKNMTEKRKNNILTQRNFLQSILNHFEVASYDFAKSSYLTLKNEAAENGIKTVDDYAKMFAFKLVEKRNNVLDEYFDEKNLKQNKQKELNAVYKPITYVKFLNNIYSKEFDKKSTSTLKTVIKNYTNNLIKLTLNKLAKNSKLQNTTEIQK